MTVKAVVFDVGNVLIEWQPEKFYDREIGSERRKELFAIVDLHGMNDGIDKGGNWRRIVYTCAESYPEQADAIRMWHDRWIELASPIIPYSVQLLRSLRRKGMPVFALTNFGIETFEYASSMYRFLDEFDRSYVSGQLRMIKPDPNIYAHVEQDSGVPPESLLFVDDRAENCDAASARGWRVHHFEEPRGWADRLVSEGLLSQEEAAFWGSG
jgi:2-haloacid dehalogenase